MASPTRERLRKAVAGTPYEVTYSPTVRSATLWRDGRAVLTLTGKAMLAHVRTLQPRTEASR